MAARDTFVRYRKWLVALSVVVGVALIVIAVIYWVEPAGSLPSFFPGHEAGSSHHHVKHGIAAFFVGLACLAFAWFNTGPKGTAPKKGADQTPPDAG
jgi:UDP-N-acetylmuramyl pentapeptide phosphotransferase/UDP-N-acetylglucosamine-1-phosphate transferase